MLQRAFGSQNGHRGGFVQDGTCLVHPGALVAQNLLIDGKMRFTPTLPFQCGSSDPSVLTTLTHGTRIYGLGGSARERRQESLGSWQR